MLRRKQITRFINIINICKSIATNRTLSLFVRRAIGIKMQTYDASLGLEL